MTFIQLRPDPISRLPGVLFNGTTRPESVAAAVVEAGLDYQIGFGDDGYKFDGKFVASGSRRVLMVKQGKILRDLGSVSDNWQPLDNLEVAGYFEKVNQRYPIRGIGSLKNSGIWIAFSGDNFDIIANGKRDAQAHTIMFTDWKRPGTATRLVDSPIRMFCQNQKYWIMRNTSVSITIEHVAGNKTIIEYASELLAGIAGRQTAVQQALQNMADFKLTQKQVVAARNLAYPIPGKPNLSQFSLDTADGAELTGPAAELSKLASFGPVKEAAAKQNKSRDNKVKHTEDMRSAFDESFDSLATEYGRSAYSVIEAVSEVNLWRDNGKGEVVTDTLSASGERYGAMQRAGNYLTALLAKN